MDHLADAAHQAGVPKLNNMNNKGKELDKELLNLLQSRESLVQQLHKNTRVSKKPLITQEIEQVNDRIRSQIDKRKSK